MEEEDGGEFAQEYAEVALLVEQLKHPRPTSRLFPNTNIDLEKCEERLYDIIRERYKRMGMYKNSTRDCAEKNVPNRRKKCAVYKCPNNVFNEKVRYFTISADNEFRRNKWISLAANPDLAEYDNVQICRNYSICGWHFADTQFTSLTDRIKLLAKQDPEINLPSTCKGVEDLERRFQQLLAEQKDNKMIHKPFTEPAEVKEEIGDDSGHDIESDLMQNSQLFSLLNTNDDSSNFTGKTIPSETENDAAVNNKYVFTSVKIKTKGEPLDICRICMKPATQKIKLFDHCHPKRATLLRHCLSFVLPDLNLDIYPNPDICYSCYQLLKSSYEFKKKWLKTEEVLYKYVSAKPTTDNPVQVVIEAENNDEGVVRVDHDYCTPEHFDETTWEDLPSVQELEETQKNIEHPLTDSQFEKIEHKKIKKIDLGEPPYLCDSCGKTFLHVKSYKRHRKSHEMENNTLEPIICDVCGIKLEKNISLKRHYMSHRPRRFSCDVCDKNFLFQNHLQKHMSVHGPKVKKRKEAQCHLCGVKIAKTSLLQHLKKHDPKGKKHICNICAKSFLHPCSLKKHLKSHYTLPTWKCNICGKTMKYKDTLQKHIEIKHLKQGENVCNICGKILWSKAKLRAHLEFHRKCVMKPSLRMKRRRVQNHPCKFCGKILKYEKTLRQHISVVHLKEGSSCDVCQKVLWDKQKLKYHYLKMHGVVFGENGSKLKPVK